MPGTRWLESFAQHLTLVVRDDAVPLVERHAGQRRAEVADRAVQRLDRNLAHLARCRPRRPRRPGACAPRRRRDAALVVRATSTGLAQKCRCRRRDASPPALFDRRALAPRLQHAVDHHDLLVAGDRGLRGFVVVEVLVVDDHVDVAQLAELAQLQRGELHLRGSAATEHVHVGDRARLQALVDVVRHLGGQQVLRVLREHARDVERDVAVADHGDRCRVQRPLAGHVGVPVEPADEVGGAVGGDRVDAGDVQRRRRGSRRSRRSRRGSGA